MPTTYFETKLNISDNQKDKIRRALNAKEPVTIRITETGDDILALTQTQINKINRALSNKKAVNITLSKAQIKYNLKIQGGFLGMLAGLAARFLPQIASTLLPALGVGAAQELAATAVKKIVGNGTIGDGLYLKRGDCTCKIETDGHGIFLDPTRGSGLKLYGDGLYLSREGKIYDGSGFLGNLVKNIPLLNLLF
jgi:hypothetical protein